MYQGVDTGVEPEAMAHTWKIVPSESNGES